MTKNTGILLIAGSLSAALAGVWVLRADGEDASASPEPAVASAQAASTGTEAEPSAESHEKMRELIDLSVEQLRLERRREREQADESVAREAADSPSSEVAEQAPTGPREEFELALDELESLDDPSPQQSAAAELIMNQIVGIHGGNCPITADDAMEHYGDDQSLAEILAGLAYLHEDLQFRESERDRVQRELQQQNEELEDSRRQLAALADELSTPVIKVSRGVLMIPLIGSFDSSRAADMMERLLGAVTRDNAQYVILDLTGVSSVDTSIADQFLRIIGAIRLLGAEGVIAGIQPSVGMSMIALGVDVSGIPTTRNAEEAVAYCRKHERRKRDELRRRQRQRAGDEDPTNNAPPSA